MCFERGSHSRILFVCRCVCQSAPVCAPVVPVCCERGLTSKIFSNKSKHRKNPSTVFVVEVCLPPRSDPPEFAPPPSCRRPSKRCAPLPHCLRCAANISRARHCAPHLKTLGVGGGAGGGVSGGGATRSLSPRPWVVGQGWQAARVLQCPVLCHPTLGGVGVAAADATAAATATCCRSRSHHRLPPTRLLRRTSLFPSTSPLAAFARLPFSPSSILLPSIAATATAAAADAAASSFHTHTHTHTHSLHGSNKRDCLTTID